jgi:hypothetical protein
MSKNQGREVESEEDSGDDDDEVFNRMTAKKKEN